MLKRINLHLSERQCDILGQWVKELNKVFFSHPISRADLIRFAVSKIFDTNFPSIHAFRKDIEEEILKIKESLTE